MKPEFPLKIFFSCSLGGGGYFSVPRGVVYELHGGCFINHNPGEFVNPNLFIKLKALLCGHRTERGESLKLNIWPRGRS